MDKGKIIGCVMLVLAAILGFSPVAYLGGWKALGLVVFALAVPTLAIVGTLMVFPWERY